MSLTGSLRLRTIGVTAVLFLTVVTHCEAQLSGPPTANCHVTDGQFTTCPNGVTEWSDVRAVAFPSTNSYLYVNQDAAHGFLYLMYDLPFRTAPLASTDSVHINFNTVETLAGSPALVLYDIYIFGNGQIQVLQQGQPTPPGRIIGAAGFGSSPNSATPHVKAELQVPLVQGPPSTYSPDPLFWSATVPPTPPPPPPPPSCPVTVLGVCVKSQAQIDAWNQQAAVENAKGDALTSLAQGKAADVKNTAPACLVALSALGAALAPGPADVTVQQAMVEVQGALEDPELLVLAAGAAVSAAQGANGSTQIAMDAAKAVSACSALLGAAGGWLVDATEAAADYALAKGYLTLAQDPPDPNFTVIAAPVVPALSVLPLTTATGFSPQVVSDMNSLLSNLEQQIALLRVMPTTINRVSGAVEAGNAFWQGQQVQALQKYVSQITPLLQAELSLEATLTNDLKTSGVVFTFSSNDVANALNLIKQNGFPGGMTTALTQLGMDAGAQAAILQTLLSSDPALVAALGTGVFPDALSDPSFAAATKDAIKAFSALAGLATQNIFLLGTDAVSFHGDRAFASQLWAHLGANVAYINNFGLSGVTTVAGQPVTGFSSVPTSLSGFSTLFFASPGRCCSDPSTASSLGITSNASAIASYLAGGGGMVIENFQGASAWDSILGFPSASGVTFGVPSPSGSDPGVSTAAGVAAGFTGDGAGPNKYVDFSFVHEAYSDSFFALHGFTSLIDAASLPSGSGVVLQEAATSGTVATPVTTATAAVVQANTNGDTVVNLRGIAPSDAPTLQDQIQMIVESRVIQNPSLSASQLTTQLVNSLPPSVLPPGQAQNIINAVTSVLVPPPPVISGMPGLGCSLWPPNHKLVQVATVTASDAVGGILPGSFQVTGTSNEPSNSSTDPEIVITPNGSGGYVIQLQADRLGTGTGRIYTLTATAKNSVGAATTSTATCTVPHDQGH